MRFQLDQLLPGFANFLDSHFAHVRITVLEQRLCALQVTLHPEQLRIERNDRLHFGVFTGIGAKACLIADDFRVAEQRGQFLETVAEHIQLIEQ